jgi:hypothetical protein
VLVCVVADRGMIGAKTLQDALVLKKALEDCIAELGKPGSWPEILADLDSLTEFEVEQDISDLCCAPPHAPLPASR